MEYINKAIELAPTALAFLAAAHAAALIIVNATPTPKDDAALAKAYGFVEFLAGLFTSKAKQ